MYIKPQFLQLESPLLISSNTNNSVLITKLFQFDGIFSLLTYIDTYRIRIPGNSQNIFKRFKIIYICTYVRNLNFKVLMVQKYFLAIYIIYHNQCKVNSDDAIDFTST